jgi:transcription elongation factor GreB
MLVTVVKHLVVNLIGENNQAVMAGNINHPLQDFAGIERTCRIVGVDEVDLERGYVSWVSPIAKALIKAKLGDTVKIQTPAGPKEIDIVAVNYDEL